MTFQSKLTASSLRPDLRRAEVALCLFLFALAVALRLPGAWAEGRFQDEELSVFLAYAWQFPAGEAFWRAFGGYWNLVANGFTLLLAEAIRADIISLVRAPYFTMVAGLLSQTLPALLLLTGKASWLPDRRARLLAVLLIAFLPGVEEVYLNVLHAQFHLAFACALILALDVPERRRTRILYASILLLAPLCGPGAILLLPLFALRAFIERDVSRGWQLAVLGAASACQMLLFYSPTAVRGLGFDPVNVLAAITIRMMVFPALGGGIADKVALALEGSINGNRILLWTLAAAPLLLFGALLVRLARRRESSFWLLSAALLVAGLSLGAGLASTNAAAPFFISAGYRYNYIPLGLLSLCLLSVALRSSGRERTFFSALVLLLLMVGVIEYSRPMKALANGPSWHAEVAAWKKDPNHRLAVWPVPYRADLSGRKVDCGPPGVRWGSATAPRYCESGWMYQSFGLPERPR